MKDVKNSNPLRMALIHFLEYEQRMTQLYITMEQFNAASTDEAVNAALEQLKASAAGENTAL